MAQKPQGKQEEPPPYLQPAPPPPTALGWHRPLSSTAGIRVSPLCLGAMSIGDAWAGLLGAMDKKQAFDLLDAFYDKGGNFVDTANIYQDGQSEQWIGEWMNQHKRRDHMVIATKYTFRPSGARTVPCPAVNNAWGNHKRSMAMSVRDSLSKLQTDWIDILYVHWWDYTTSIEEVMDSLHILVQQGKVLYLGISDTPAWVVSQANTYAKMQGKTPFSVYQGEWSPLKRDFEREIIPMALHHGMALCPWGVLGGGKLQTRKQIAEREAAGEQLRSNQGPRTGEHAEMSDKLEDIASKHGLESVTAIALAYVRAKLPGSVFPLIGGRKISHLEDNIQGLEVELTEDEIKEIERVGNFDYGFPTSMIGQDFRITGRPGFLSAAAGSNVLDGNRRL